MGNAGFARFRAQYVESGAYHEAGHMTAAVVQKMPLRERGVHVDSEGQGISYYWDRLPGDLGNSEQDRVERENTIIAIYAGWAAQRTFFPDCPQEGWESDRDKVSKLLDEMHQNDLLSRRATRNELWERARALVDKYWSVIQQLAIALLAKPYTPQPAIEIQENWSLGKSSVEKWMSGAEVTEFFQKLGIRAFAVRDRVGKYHPHRHS